MYPHNQPHGHSRRPFIWEGMTPAQRERLWRAAVLWFEREAAKMRERADADRAEERAGRNGQHEPKLRELPRCADCPFDVDPLACGLSPSCPDSMQTAPTRTPEQARRRARKRRLWRFLRRNGGVIVAALANDLAQFICKIAADKQEEKDGKKDN